MPKQTLMGTLLNKIKAQRDLTRKEAIEKIWEKNKLGNAQKRQGYKVEEDTTVDAEGNSIIAVKLWQLVDQSHTKISADISIDNMKAVIVKEKPKAQKPETADALENLMAG